MKKLAFCYEIQNKKKNKKFRICVSGGMLLEKLDNCINDPYVKFEKKKTEFGNRCSVLK